MFQGTQSNNIYAHEEQPPFKESSYYRFYGSDAGLYGSMPFNISNQSQNYKTSQDIIYMFATLGRLNKDTKLIDLPPEILDYLKRMKKDFNQQQEAAKRVKENRAALKKILESDSNSTSEEQNKIPNNIKNLIYENEESIEQLQHLIYKHRKQTKKLGERVTKINEISKTLHHHIKKNVTAMNELKSVLGEKITPGLGKPTLYIPGTYSKDRGSQLKQKAIIDSMKKVSKFDPEFETYLAENIPLTNNDAKSCINDIVSAFSFFKDDLIVRSKIATNQLKKLQIDLNLDPDNPSILDLVSSKTHRTALIHYTKQLINAEDHLNEMQEKIGNDAKRFCLSIESLTTDDDEIKKPKNLIQKELTIQDALILRFPELKGPTLFKK